MKTLLLCAALVAAPLVPLSIHLAGPTGCGACRCCDCCTTGDCSCGATCSCPCCGAGCPGGRGEGQAENAECGAAECCGGKVS